MLPRRVLGGRAGRAPWRPVNQTRKGAGSNYTRFFAYLTVQLNEQSSVLKLLAPLLLRPPPRSPLSLCAYRSPPPPHSPRLPVSLSLLVHSLPQLSLSFSLSPCVRAAVVVANFNPFAKSDCSQQLAPVQSNKRFSGKSPGGLPTPDFPGFVYLARLSTASHH